MTLAKRQPYRSELGPLEITYRLAQLPSSQHRAGLAGLVLMIRWLDQHPKKKKGLVKIEELGPGHARVRLDRHGVAALFDEVYGAAAGETESKQPYRDKRTRADKPPLRVEERQIIDKQGKSRNQRVYVYPAIRPRGAFQAAWDPSCCDGTNGLWVKLWRDTVWTILRGVPATRKAYELRATNRTARDADNAWLDLLAGEKNVELPSTYFLGAQARTAENVAFRDRARDFFLLHFWHFVAGISVPSAVDHEGKSSFRGHALIVPDVADLEAFVLVFPDVLRSRGTEIRAYLPRDSVVDLPIEGAVELLRLFGARLQRVEGARSTSDLVRGFDVIHAAKSGNNVRVLSVARVEPRESMINEYARIKGVYWNPTFRHQRLLNLLNDRPWWSGFGALCATASTKLTIGSRYFGRDARRALTETEMSLSETDSGAQAAATIEERVYRIVRGYLGRRLLAKYAISWQAARQSEDKKRDYSAKREKLAREAFLAIRSRAGADFVEYFSATLCSTPQPMDEEMFVAISRALLEETERVRTLTLLALSANG